MKNKCYQLSLLFIIIVVNLILAFSNSYAIDWYQVYNTKWVNGLSPRATLAWSETYILRSYISMYRASKARNEPQAEQEKWIDRIITHCDTIVNSQDMEKEGRANLVYAGHGFTPLASTVKLIFDDDDLYSIYKNKANLYLRYIEEKLIPFWRYYHFQETPFNWFLSYGCMLLNLHRVSGSKYYGSAYYQTPDTTLKDYYLSTVTDMAANYFQDFQNWEYSGIGWNNSPYPQNKGLCYYPITKSYLWRYFDYTGSLIFWGYKGEDEYQGLEGIMPYDLNKWYKIDLLFHDDSLTRNFYDSDGTTLLSRITTNWDITITDSDILIGKRVDGNEYFNGVIDEVKLSGDGNTIALWKMEGNAADSSGNNLNGTIHGTPNTVDGKSGKAFQFKGGDYISIPNNTKFDSIGRIELWVKFLELNTARYYILGRGKHFHYGPGGFHLFMDCYKRPEDVGHANLDIEFMANAANDVHCQGLYPKAELTRVCNTFTKNIWSNSDTLHPAFRSHIVPADEYGEPDYEGHTFRWLWLHQYEPFVGTLISNWYEAHPASQNLTEAIANLACWQAGLKATDDEIVSVADEGRNSLTEGEIIVFPNPVADWITIAYPGLVPSNVNISICNSVGIEIMRFGSKELSSQTHVGFSTESLAPGVYYCFVNAGYNILTGRFIVLR